MLQTPTICVIVVKDRNIGTELQDSKQIVGLLPPASLPPLRMLTTPAGMIPATSSPHMFVVSGVKGDVLITIVLPVIIASPILGPHPLSQ